MRTTTLFFFLFLVAQTLFAQNNVFVLVDVSGSGPDKTIKVEAGNIVKDLLANQFNSANYSKDWKWSDSLLPPFDRVKGTSQSLLTATLNSTLMIMPFGKQDRYENYKIQKISNLPSDVLAMFDNYYPKIFSDQYTYIEIAQAKAAGVAKTAGFDSFYRIEVTDAMPVAPQSNYSPDEQFLIQNDNSTKTKLGEFVFGQTAFRIIFTRVSIANSPNLVKTPIAKQNIDKKDLAIIKPSGTLKKPTVLNPPSVSIAWQCLGCADGTTYTVSLLNTKDKKVKVAPKKTNESSATFSITEPGVYKVSVSGDGASARSVYFEVKGKSGGGGFWVVLLLLGAAILGYYFWNKRRNDNLERDPNDHSGGVTNYQPSPSSNAAKPKWGDSDDF